MPSYPTPSYASSYARSGPRRRTLLTGAAATAGAVLLSGCSDSGSAEDERSSAADRLRAGAARDSGELLGRYDAVLAAHPSLAGRLDPLRAEVKRHKTAFADGLATPSASASPASAASPSSSPSAPPVPTDEKDAVRELAKAERELAKRRGSALLDAPDELARLLASVAAAGAAHAYLLTEGDK
ncbi:hypothetical protein AB0I94_18445 [Streptomyces sp. NPDC050147]|uniref:hypothetical protein n=1 Tax=Streptomyces sp. NPDC050147 TaxID=3155513 RepID=UPI003448A32D